MALVETIWALIWHWLLKVWVLGLFRSRDLITWRCHGTIEPHFCQILNMKRFERLTRANIQWTPRGISRRDIQPSAMIKISRSESHSESDCTHRVKSRHNYQSDQWYCFLWSENSRRTNRKFLLAAHSSIFPRCTWLNWYTLNTSF